MSRYKGRLKAITPRRGIMKWRDRIRGTRVKVSVILDDLADNVPADDRSDSTLRPEDIQAALAHAADLVRERVVRPSRAKRPG